ncbi:MAG: hypothetical protein U0556_06025 [Dehalococcoidia bacterium]
MRDKAEVHEPEFAAVGAILPSGFTVRQGVGRRKPDGTRTPETLYALIGGPARADAALAMDQIEGEFVGSSRTTSAKLVEGIQSASREVAQENRRSLPQDRFRLDLALTVLRGREAMFSLAGSARAYVLRDGELFDVGADVIGPPLGDDDPGVPLFLRAQLADDDLVILTSGDLLDHAEASQVAAWFRGGVKRGARALSASIGNQLGAIIFEPGALPEESRTRSFAVPGAETLRSIPIEGVVSGAGGAAAALLKGVVPMVRLFLPAAGEREEPAHPDPQPEPLRPERQSGKPGLRPRYLAVGVLLAIVLVGLGAGIPAMFNNDRGEGAYVTAITEAERAYRASVASTDQGFARTRLREAEFAAQRALTARKDDPAATKLQESIRAEALKLDRVARVGGVQQIADLAAAGAKEPTGLVVEAGTTAYVLDPTGWGLRRIALEPNKPPEPQIVAVRGTPSDETPVGDPLAIAWLYPVDARARVGVMLLDRDRNLFYQPANKSLVELAVRGAASWQSAQAIRGYVGNLYVLDAKGNQVWRYLPNWNGYDTEMKGMLEGAQIGDARDFTIDGNIYILTDSGRVWKFVEGVGSEFDLRSLDKPLNKPTAILTGATARGVYVADPANQRVVVFDKDGRFQRQLVSENFAGLSAFTVDEALGKIWYIADKKLYSAPLPK